MFTQLLPEQVSKYWDFLSWGIAQSLPPIIKDDVEALNRLLVEILAGKMQCWAVAEEGRIKAVSVTQILRNDVTKKNSLLLYSLFGYERLGEEVWKAGYEAAVKYAKAKKCKHIVAYTQNEKVIEMAKAFDGDSTFTFVSFEVK